MDKLKTGIIGTGFSASFHLEALRRLPQVEVTAIAGSSAEKAKTKAAEYAIPKAYGTAEELIADEEVEVVHNCTPNDRHFDINALALKSGKHLLSEKPLALDCGQSEELVKLAAAASGASGVCFNYRHYPLVAESKRRIAAGRIGGIHLITGGYLQDWLLEETDADWRLFPEHSGATRAIADIGSHWCDLVQHVSGLRIVEVFADLKTVHPMRKIPSGEDGGGCKEVPIETEDCGNVMVRFDNGAQGMFTVSQVSAGRKNKLFFEISGARESLHWDQEQPNRLWSGRRGTPNREIMADPESLSETAAAMVHYPGGHEEGWPDGVKNLFIDFYDEVQSRKQGAESPSRFRTFASMSEGHYIMRINDAIARSAKRKAWTSV